MTAHPIDAVVFDLGGVLIDWNPRHLYRSLFDDEAAMERFLTEVCSPEWNLAQDAGRPWRAAVDLLVGQYPDQRELIEAYDDRWVEMLGGPIDGTVAVLADLRQAGLRVAALSNWSAEKFAIARPRYPFLEWFETIVISGDIGICKPDPRIYRHLLEQTGLQPSRVAFIDDSQANIDAASALGMRAVRFHDPTELRIDLQRLGLAV